MIFISNLSFVNSTRSVNSGNYFSATSAQTCAAFTILLLDYTNCSFSCSRMKRTRSDCLISYSRFCSAFSLASSNSATCSSYDSNSCMISGGYYSLAWFSSSSCWSLISLLRWATGSWIWRAIFAPRGEVKASFSALGSLFTFKFLGAFPFSTCRLVYD